MSIISAIRSAKNIILSTHKSSDGDGLGSEIAMYFALKKLGKSVHFVHIDLIPSRYHFLLSAIPKEAFLRIDHLSSSHSDLALIFDTHDPKLCSPLYENLLKLRLPIYFLDHHVRVASETDTHLLEIDESASCTGEIVYDLIQRLEIPLDQNMATALYASLIFDTQNFKVIRDASKPFLMARHLLTFGIDPVRLQDQLFAHWNVAKMNYFAFLINQASYYENQSVVILRILKKDMTQFQVESDQVSDVIDLFMQIKSLTVAVVIREETAAYHKLSFRSRGSALALTWALVFQGGGHSESSGAWVSLSLPEIEKKLYALIETHSNQKRKLNSA